MGVLNCTPDSFWQASRTASPQDALDRALQLFAEGAAVIDIGGASSHPDAPHTTLQEEKNRVLPVLKHIRQAAPHIPLSLDSCQPDLIHEALDLGVAWINDIDGACHQETLKLLASHQTTYCLMIQGPFTHMDELLHTCQQRIDRCLDAGLAPTQLVLDPGFGFGKTHAMHTELLQSWHQLTALNHRLLLGVSRKGYFRHISDLPELAVEDRAIPSLVAGLWASAQHCDYLRTHDVLQTHRALATLNQLMASK